MNGDSVEGFLLSPQQSHLWNLVCESPQTFECRITLSMDGPLDVERLQEALHETVKHHEILRTRFSFSKTAGVPVQVISEARTCPEISIFPAATAGSLGNDFSRAGSNTADLVKTSDYLHSPLDIRLIKEGPQKHLLSIGITSLCADPVSLKNLAIDLFRNYSHTSESEPPTDAPMQYADYASWRTELLESDQGTAGREFWSQNAAVDSTAFKLPFAKESFTDQRFAPAVISLKLTETQVRAIKVLCEEHTVSAKTVLLTCWAILLSRYTGESEMIIGVLADGRKYPELQSALGLYAQYLPLRLALDIDVPFFKTLGAVQTACEAALEWEEHFSWSEGKLNKTSQRFQPISFEYCDLSNIYSPPALAVRAEQARCCIDQFHLKLSAVKTDDRLNVSLHFDRSQFHDEDIERLSLSLQEMLTSALHKPDDLIGSLNITSENELEQILNKFNATHCDYPKDKCIHHLILDQGQKHPDRIALATISNQLTYRELIVKATGVAKYLQNAGIEPGSHVGLYAERSSEMIIGILGILLAGSGYVPLDPSYPHDRLAHMVQDSGLAAVLAQSKLKGIFPIEHLKLIALDEELFQTGDNYDNLAPASPEHPAYVIYTSGSTGKPKGTVILHRNLMHSTMARIQYYKASPSRYLLLSSFAFDSSVAGIFWTLCEGGTLVLPPQDAQQDPGEIATLIKRFGVSHLLCLPSLYSYILDFAKDDSLVTLKTVIVAGESCPKRLVESHKSRLPSTKLYNEYGPTEGTVWATVFDCDSPTDRLSIPIGHPIPNVQVYILNTDQKLVPTWVPGEIYIGGDGIAPGYLNQASLTSEKFVEDHIQPGPDKRLYRTGDLGRYLPDGSIEFLGRIDHQVKIRGHRIELEEIETILRQYSKIQDAVVMARHDPTPGREAIDLGNAEDIMRLLEKFGESKAHALLDSIESLSSGSDQESKLLSLPTKEEDSFVRRTKDFDLQLNIISPSFIKPPRESQRNWLINRALNEAVHDLEALNASAQQFVAGAEQDLKNLTSDRSQAQLDDDEILEDWHLPIMQAMARVATEAHGDILEIGFGRGVSATMIQQRGVRSHTIIECNDYIINHHFAPWRQRHSDREIRLVKGKWQDVIAGLGQYDAVFFQTYPLNEQEFIEHLSRSSTFAEHFFPIAAEHLRKGGVFTYLTHEIDSLSRRHQRKLFEFFSSISLEIEKTNVPAETKDLWWADSMVIIKAVK